MRGPNKSLNRKKIKNKCEIFFVNVQAKWFHLLNPNDINKEYNHPHLNNYKVRNIVRTMDNLGEGEYQGPMPRQV